MNLVYNTLGKIPFTEKIPTIFKSISKMVTTFLSKMVTIIVLSVYLTSIFAPTYYAHMHNKYELALNTYHIWQGNRADAKLQAKKKVLKDEYDTMLKQEIFVKLGEILDLKKEQCINREVTDFLYSYAQETGEAPPSEIISMARAQADFSTCSVTNLKSDVYENLVKIPFEKEFSVSFDELEKARKYDEDTQYAQQKKALADEQKAAEDAAKAIDIDKLAETHATGPIKAVFCSYGHGMGDNGWTDNGARADDGTTERSLIMPVVGDACDKISTGLKNK